MDWEFPDGPVIRTASIAGGTGSTPGWGTKIPIVLRTKNKKTKKEKKEKKKNGSTGLCYNFRTSVQHKIPLRE